MGLVDSLIRHPIKVSVGVLMVSLFGLVAVDQMPLQLTPEVQTPTITVDTTWQGASPQEIEQEIIVEQEEQLKGVEGVSEMSSESSDSRGRVILEFAVGTDMRKAVVDVVSRLEQVRDYPEDSDKPVLSTADANDRPIAWFMLSARRPSREDLLTFQKENPDLKEEIDSVLRSSESLIMMRLRRLAATDDRFQKLLPPEDLDVIKLRRFAEDEIESRFERVYGVSQANVLGGLENELQVVVDPQKLAASRLTVDDVRRVLSTQNEDTSAGDYWEGKRRWVTRTLGQFRTPQQVEEQLLAVRDGAPVYIRDVAVARLGYKKPDGFVYRFGETCIAINALRETGANVLDVMATLREVADELNEGVLAERGLEIVQVYDETDYIYSSIDLVRQNIFIGGALTMVVLMAFLHFGTRAMIVIPLILASALGAAYVSPWFFAVCLVLIIGSGFWFARGALVVGLAIPISIVGTFLILHLLGRSLNVVSLAGMAFAVGMLVDNAVVVLENIYRRHAMGEPPFTAAAKGTEEVWGAVVSSTLTTVAVFLPIVFVQEEAGQLFRDIALAISAAVSLSLVVSVVVIPAAAARLFHDHQDDDPGGHSDADSFDQADGTELRSRMIRGVNSIGGAFIGGVIGLNSWVQRHVARQLLVIGLLVGMSLGLSYLFWPKVEYLPTGNRNLIFGILLPPPGYNLDELTSMGKVVETTLQPYWDIDPAEVDLEALDYPAIGDFFFVSRDRRVFVGVRALDQSRASDLVPLVQKAGKELPGTFMVAKQSSLFERGLSAGRTIDVEITGPDLPQLVALGGQVMGMVKTLMPDAQARPVPSLDLSSPEMHIRPKLIQAAQMGVNSSDLGYAANALIDGAYAGDYFLEGDKIDLTILGQEQFAQRSQDVRALPVATPIGAVVPLEALASIQLSSGPEQINHRERIRAITVEVSPPPAMALEDAMTLIQQEVVAKISEQGSLKGGYRIHLAGTADKLRDTWQALRFNIFLALLITYLLMAALFESWLYPFVIIFSVPLGAVGGVLGLYALNIYLASMGQLPQQLDVLTMLGFVVLIGTVVNNPILIVHQSLNHMREDDMAPTEAILASVQTRIRPIFMTTMTTVLGLLPLVLFPGAGSELYRGLGSVVLGGLMVSTVFTLFLVPTLFSITMYVRDQCLHLLGRSSSPAHHSA
ncbi:Efflux pump membrane transporter BepE [Planctomycetes bacterium Pan216]|uniref:Efflux pump membrane transporter BepE n=1 Tax=Kolteria novifilia TaxID=2527975 RepID=A0A518B439_9BACT|nr:Efflux pump membrane transporter BepE [Planctomycetes bacterium Pan216]